MAGARRTGGRTGEEGGAPKAGRWARLRPWRDRASARGRPASRILSYTPRRTAALRARSIPAIRVLSCVAFCESRRQPLAARKDEWRRQAGRSGGRGPKGNATSGPAAWATPEKKRAGPCGPALSQRLRKAKLPGTGQTHHMTVRAKQPPCQSRRRRESDREILSRPRPDGLHRRHEAPGQPTRSRIEQ